MRHSEDFHNGHVGPRIVGHVKNEVQIHVATNSRAPNASKARACRTRAYKRRTRALTAHISLSSCHRH